MRKLDQLSFLWYCCVCVFGMWLSQQVTSSWPIIHSSIILPCKQLSVFSPPQNGLCALASQKMIKGLWKNQLISFLDSSTSTLIFDHSDLQSFAKLPKIVLCLYRLQFSLWDPSYYFVGLFIVRESVDSDKWSLSLTNRLPISRSMFNCKDFWSISWESDLVL